MKGLFVILILTAVGAAWFYLPASHHQSATGIYFVRQYISFNTPTGVTGWAPGQEIREVLKAPAVEGSKTVTDGILTAVVPEAALTRDVEDAEVMRLADTESQGQAQTDANAMKMQYDAQERTAQVAAAQNISRMNAQQVAASTVGTYKSGLNEPTHYVGGGGGWSTTYYVFPSRSLSTGGLRASSFSQSSSRNDTFYAHHNVAPRPTPLPSGTAR